MIVLLPDAGSAAPRYSRRARLPRRQPGCRIYYGLLAAGDAGLSVITAILTASCSRRRQGRLWRPVRLSLLTLRGARRSSFVPSFPGYATSLTAPRIMPSGGEAAPGYEQLTRSRIWVRLRGPQPYSETAGEPPLSSGGQNCRRRVNTDPAWRQRVKIRALAQFP
jgi:hypothetical protein